ncbi:VOC family protein [Brevibacillus nitrificans]|uniref:VOC family protein n=1 Tax=Brevibacillus nitrificans TaxID=651560 RepID=UPI00285F48CC|nr:VOC family protein [Brevibacillus nitrificans]MDR7314718.1 catechol 2,3-dioxygenase-like lactoylglutathione lyase family enzyme [Brevibacillus nitrificans]
MYPNKSYVEHIAFYVRDIQWHIRFFQEALGMPMVRMEGVEEGSKQAWLLGGLQLIEDKRYAGNEGRMGHIAIMTEDLELALEEIYSWGCTQLPKGQNWVLLPEGLVLELIQAKADTVHQLLNMEVSYV